MSILRTIGIWVGTVFVLALLFFGYNWYRGLAPARLAKWRADSTAVADTTRAATLRSVKADTQYQQGATIYLRGRDRILHDTVHPPSVEVRACYAAADSLFSLCAIRHAADSSEKAALRAELAVARAKPTERPKRLNLFGEGLYDVLHMAPVFRAGAELRLLGPITAVGAADLSIPPAGQSRVNARALVGIRYVF